jgi:hypothetical protein
MKLCSDTANPIMYAWIAGVTPSIAAAQADFPRDIALESHSPKFGCILLRRMPLTN